MTLVVGVDPGVTGAMALYDAAAGRLLSIEDMPTYTMPVGRKKRQFLDALAFHAIVEGYVLCGVELVCIEKVGGMPGQSASSGFNFGRTVGIIHHSFLLAGIAIEEVAPAVWKRSLRVPGKAAPSLKERKDALGAIQKRCNELFPTDRDMFLTKRGAYRHDRAEAALLAKYAGDWALTIRGLGHV